MAISTSPADGRLRLADRAGGRSAVRFVGRAAELALLGSALAEEEPPFTLLYVHGPGGVAKTVLLGEFVRLAAEARVSVVGLDGRDLEEAGLRIDVQFNDPAATASITLAGCGLWATTG